MLFTQLCAIALALAATGIASPLSDCTQSCARGLSLSSSNSSEPVPAPVPVSAPPSFAPSTSFSGWGGFASLDGFDTFYGVNNFDGSHYEQVVVKDKEEVVCHSEKVRIIQQRLAVLGEMAKKIITEQICDVETQVVVFQQHHAGLGRFHNDLRRISGHKPGFDRSICGHFGKIFDAHGECTTDDFGFSGRDIGHEVIVPSQCNWEEPGSFVSVNDAYLTSLYATRVSGTDLRL